jgi:natural product precursor
MKKLSKTKLGLNKDAVKTISDDQLSRVNGGSTGEPLTTGCTPHTIMNEGGVCYTVR